MKYKKTVQATFLERPNRFIAKVDINGVIETVHVKNTGRCKELLIKGVPVILEEGANQNRKTKYDLVSVYKKNIGWINIDSQLPNKLVYEWLHQKDFSYIKPEFTFGKSRIDFYMERADDKKQPKIIKKFLLEIKGCTLEINGIGYFPDAPTERGTKHLEELTSSIQQGYEAIVGFVIQMNGIKEVRPNSITDKAFTKAFNKAIDAGVKILFIYCEVTESSVEIIGHKFFKDNSDF